MNKMFLSEKWSEIIRDMEGDDVVLEIKVDDANLEKQNALLQFLRNISYDVKYFDGGSESNLPSRVDSEVFFNGEGKEVIINLSTCELRYYFNSLEEMDFYTSSVIHLKYEEAAPLFDFMRRLGEFLDSKIYLYIESYPKYSYVFDPKFN